MIPDLVSTIIPVFNRAAMLREAVASVLAQSWRPIEIIIVDDGSTDDTLAVAAELADRYPDTVRVLQQDNAGPGVARQRGLAAAHGEFVQFLDSDDLLLPEKFAAQVAGLRSDSEADIAYGKSMRELDGKRSPHPETRTMERHRALFPVLLKYRIWETITPLYRRALLDKIAPWPSKRQLEDWEYDAQAAAIGAKLIFIDQFLAVSRDHSAERLCHLWMQDAGAMQERIDAYFRVLEHAKHAGIRRDLPEMQQFVRSLFWMARNAGCYGLPEQAQRLFALARSEAIKPGWDYRLFGWMARLFGWERASRWTNQLKAGAR